MVTDYQHFIITLFNLRLYTVDRQGQATQTDAWLSQRFCLFERYCLPSMAQQTNPHFTWLVLLDADTPQPYRQRMEAYRASVPQLHPLYFTKEAAVQLRSNDAGERARFLRDAVKELLAEDTRHLLTTNLDNDDALHCRMVEIIQQAFERARPRQPHLFVCPVGLQFFERGAVLLRMRYPHNHFLTLAEPVVPGEAPLTIKFYSHTRARKSLPTTDLSANPPLWLEVVHERNVSNALRLSSRIRYTCPLTALSLQPFGLPLQLTRAHNLRNALTRVPALFLGTAWRKMRRVRR